MLKNIEDEKSNDVQYFLYYKGKETKEDINYYVNKVLNTSPVKAAVIIVNWSDNHNAQATCNYKTKDGKYHTISSTWTKGAGIASYSLGIDGLSQSISSTSSATNAGYGARILGYVDDLKKVLPILISKYGGMSLSVL